MIARFLGALVAVTVLGTVTATPAFADPARPTNYESTVTAVSPPVSGLTAEVTGGDAFLNLSVPTGTTVVVSGYAEEPYLRFDADGRVFENRLSPAYWLNTDRYGGGAKPPEAVPEATPDWHLVAETGEWGWHDHRIHWMSPDLPPTITEEATGKVWDWTIPMMVDDVPVVVEGVLFWQPSVTPFPWVALALLAGALGWLVARRSIAATGAVVTVAGAMALVSSLAQASISPPGAGGS